MKAYTDIEQSKKLAEILPLDSADAWWAERYEGKVTYDGQYIVNEEPLCYISFIKPSEINYSQDTVKDIPCWSLAALLDQLEDRICDEEDNQWELVIKKENVQYDIYYLNICGEQEIIELDRFYDDLIDCCYEMILKLKEKDLI